MDERSVTPQIRTFFWGVGCAFAGIAGVVLFLFPERTDRFFAWTIVRGDTAAFIGALFLAVALVSLLCYGVPRWADVRVCFRGVLAFVTAMAVATLLHLDQFHFGSDAPVALVAAWGWTIVYLVAPLAGFALRSRQLRHPDAGGADADPDGPDPDGPDPDGPEPGEAVTPMLPGLRTLYLSQGVVLTVVAVVLFVAPGRADALWPWPLTPLAARAIASFLLGFGLMLFGAGRDDVADRLEPLGAACWWLAVLTGMAVTRFEGGFELGSVAGIVFSVVALSLFVGGVAGELAARRLRPSPPDDGPSAPSN
ncbi:MAG TPA: hypothetical protein VM942_02310 [Acidimicrobiales bacterium]|nr:hypothetical protein [Acidimicrobiales bacterium]